jgi:hypothetical protein
VWEDPVNISGGKWIIRLKKGVTDRLWEDLVLAIIGDQFDECNGDTKDLSWEDSREHGSDWPEICGCTISVRQSEDIVTLWNRVDADPKVREKIRYVALQTKEFDWSVEFLWSTGTRSGRCSIYPVRPSWNISPITVSIHTSNGRTPDSGISSNRFDARHLDVPKPCSRSKYAFLILIEVAHA